MNRDNNRNRDNETYRDNGINWYNEINRDNNRNRENRLIGNHLFSLFLLISLLLLL